MCYKGRAPRPFFVVPYGRLLFAGSVGRRGFPGGVSSGRFQGDFPERFPAGLSGLDFSGGASPAGLLFQAITFFAFRALLSTPYQEAAAGSRVKPRVMKKTSNGFDEYR